MLASSHSGAYVCLRCQSRATRQFFRTARTFAPNPRYFSEERRNHEQLAEKRPERKIYPHGRLRGKKGGEVRESTEVLPVNALGKPAEIIVLRDAGIDHAKDEEEKDIITEPEQPKKSSAKAILAAVEKTSATVDESSTIQSIDEVRDTTLGRAPRHGEPISQVDYDKLVKALDDGFTTAQLRFYTMRKGSNILYRPGARATELPHSDWMPGTTPLDEKHLIISRTVQARTVTKRRLARLIMNRSWRLHADSATDIGEIDVYDAQSFMQARNEYGTSILDQIAETRHVRMQAVNEKVLRITGDRDACMAALGDISQRCLTVHSGLLRLISKHKERTTAPLKSAKAANAPTSSPLDSEDEQKSSGLISPAACAGVGRTELNILKSMTGATVKFIHDKEGPRFVRLGGYTAEQIEDARRALYSMSNLSTRSNHSFVPPLKRHVSLEGLSPNQEALDYHNRGLPWRRDQVSVARKPRQLVNADEDQPRDRESIESKLFEAATAALPTKAANTEKSPIWKPQIESRITSRIGFVCWDSSTSQSGRDPGPNGIFVPGLAHLSPFLSFLFAASSAITPTRNVITFSFRHDPPQQNQARKHTSGPSAKFQWQKDQLPEIKFEFQIEQPGSTFGGEVPAAEREKPLQYSVYAVTGDASTCAALPDRSIDFCVNEKRIVYADMDDSSAKTTFIPAIERMTTSILGASRLRAPISLDIPIPKSWFRQKGPPLRGHKPEGSTHTHYMAAYRFVGVEHRQIIPFNVRSEQYEFATVESGKLGARYSELSVVQPKVVGADNFQPIEKRRRLSSAIRTGLKMVDLVDRASKGLLSFKDTKEGEEPNELNAEHEVADPSNVCEPVVEETLFDEDAEQRFAAAG